MPSVVFAFVVFPNTPEKNVSAAHLLSGIRIHSFRKCCQKIKFYGLFNTAEHLKNFINLL